MCEVMTRATCPLEMSFATPIPGRAVSLPITVRFLQPRATSASMSRWGAPTPMKPPIIRLAPSGMRRAASSTGIAVFMMFLWAFVTLNER
jgi:hypothetical protein